MLTKLRSTDIHIRWMIRRDMPEVLAIESESFPSPYTEDDFIKCLRQRNCIAMVVEHKERVVGYVMYLLHKSSLELLSMAVDPAFRRRSIGCAMLRKLQSKVSDRRTQLTTYVIDSNLHAQLFLRANGWRATRVHREYFNNAADAYVFTWSHNTK